MPRPIKKRIVKKVSTEDDVMNVYERAKDYYGEKAKNVQMFVVALIVLIVVSLSLYLYFKRTSSRALEFQVNAYNSYLAAMSQNDRKLFDESLGQFQKAYEIKNSPVALYYQGEIYQVIGETDKAIDTLSVLIERFSSDEFVLPLAYRKLGMLYVQKGDYEKALKVFGDMAGHSLTVYGDFAIYQIGKIYKKTGNEEEAVKNYRRLVELFPASPYAREVEALLKPEKEDVTEEQAQGKAGNKEGDKE